MKDMKFCTLGCESDHNCFSIKSKMKLKMKEIGVIVFMLLINGILVRGIYAQTIPDSSNVELSQAGTSTELREYIDLQMHPTMHMTYAFFGKGFTYFPIDKEPKLSNKHLFKNVNFANYWKDNEGSRIIVAGALNKEGIRNPKKARRLILAQLEYINRFAAENSDEFVVAKSPQEVRNLIDSTDKTIIIHSVEGARRLVNSQEDAEFWADQGVAFMTLIHLRDTELGSSAILPGFNTHLINYRGSLRSKKKRGGLTDLGKQTILWLANAGIMIDITHMSEQSRTDALDLMEQHGIPPISTHDGFRPIQNHTRGINEEEIIRIYQNNGFVSLPISGISLEPYRESEKIKAILDTMSCYCNGSIDSYLFTYEALKAHIESNAAEISGNEISFDNLSEEEKVAFSIGFQSDFNGWVNHSRPKYGKKGCFEIEEGKEYEPIELDGMPHPGYLESQWKFMESQGADLEPIKRNSEHFIQLWEEFLRR